MGTLQEVGAGYIRNVIEALGDLVVGDSIGAPVAFPKGANGSYLRVKSDGTGLEWSLLNAEGLTFINGAVLRGYSDNQITEKWSINSANGTAAFGIITGTSIIANASLTMTSGAGVCNIQTDSATAFIVQDTNPTKVLVVDTTAFEIEARNGADLRGFSDDGTTEKWSIDGATGNIQTDGNLTVDGSADFNGAATFDSSTTDAYKFRSGTSNRVVIDNNNGVLRLPNGVDLRAYSDDMVTEKVHILGESGEIDTKGVIMSDLPITSRALAVKTANYTLTANDLVIGANASSGAFTLTLPAAGSTITGKVYFIYKEDNSANAVTIDGNSSETIQDELTILLNGYQQAVLIVNTGSKWKIVGEYSYGLPEHARGRYAEVSTNPGATTRAVAGSPDVSTAGTLSNSDDNDGAWITTTTAATTGSAASWFSGTLFRPNWDVDFVTRIKMPATITSARFWVGLFSTGVTGSDDPSAHIAGFRYSSVADGDGNWRAVTKDGTTINVQTTGVAVASAVHEFRIKMRVGEVKFYIDNKLVATSTSNTPASGTGMLHNESVTTLENVAKEISMSRVAWRCK